MTMVVLMAWSVGAAAAHAADAAPASGDDVVTSFALAPTGPDSAEPGSRPNLSYAISPGDAVQDSVTLWNYGNTELTFDIYAADAFTTKSGGFDVLAGGDTSRDAGSWVTLAQHQITLAPASSIDIPFAVTVPADATPGDHAAGIIASSRTPGTTAEGHHVVIDRRTGSRLYVRVAGHLDPTLVVDSLHSDYHPSVNPLKGELDVTYTVRNAGNVRLGAHQQVTISDLFGTVDEREPADIEELLPGATLTFHEHFTGVAATLRVGAEVSVVPFLPKTATGKVPDGAGTASASTHAWAIPWTLLILLAVVAGVAWALRHHRKRQRSAAIQGPVIGAA